MHILFVSQFYPRDSDDDSTIWEDSDISIKVGLATATATLPKLRIKIPPGYYILFLGTLIHGGASCMLPGGGWRLHT
jgi:hypothetical protein